MSVHEITSLANLRELFAANTYVILDFWAEWCPPCKAIAPLYAKFAADNSVPDHFAFAKVNVDDVPDVAQEYQVSAMPTFLFFTDGEPGSIACPATGPCVVPTPGHPGVVSALRGADPRALKAVVDALKTAALAKAAAAKAAGSGEEKKKEEEAKPAAGGEEKKKEEEEDKPAAAAAAAADAPAVEDTKTVSGGYTMGSSGEKRADWKMSLQA